LEKVDDLAGKLWDNKLKAALALLRAQILEKIAAPEVDRIMKAIQGTIAPPNAAVDKARANADPTLNADTSTPEKTIASIQTAIAKVDKASTFTPKFNDISQIPGKDGIEKSLSWVCGLSGADLLSKATLYASSGASGIDVTEFGFDKPNAVLDATRLGQAAATQAATSAMLKSAPTLLVDGGVQVVSQGTVIGKTIIATVGAAKVTLVESITNPNTFIAAVDNSGKIAQISSSLAKQLFFSGSIYTAGPGAVGSRTLASLSFSAAPRLVTSAGATTGLTLGAANSGAVAVATGDGLKLISSSSRFFNKAAIFSKLKTIGSAMNIYTAACYGLEASWMVGKAGYSMEEELSAAQQNSKNADDAMKVALSKTVKKANAVTKLTEAMINGAVGSDPNLKGSSKLLNVNTENSNLKERAIKLQQTYTTYLNNGDISKTTVYNADAPLWGIGDRLVQSYYVVKSGITGKEEGAITSRLTENEIVELLKQRHELQNQIYVMQKAINDLTVDRLSALSPESIDELNMLADTETVDTSSFEG
jgi:hypothetical protein